METQGHKITMKATNKNYYNMGYLIRVSVKDFKRVSWYRVVKEKKLFGFVIQKPGIKDGFDRYIEGELPSDYVLNNGKVYKKPHIVMYYIDGSQGEMVFDTYKEAVSFKDVLVSKGNWV